jgi:hypothetical protein
LAHAFLWEYSYRRLELAHFLDQLGAFFSIVRAVGAGPQRAAGRPAAR